MLTTKILNEYRHCRKISRKNQKMIQDKRRLELAIHTDVKINLAHTRKLKVDAKLNNVCGKCATKKEKQIE